MTSYAPTGNSTTAAAAGVPPVRGRTNPVMLITGLVALALAVARLVTGLGMETVDPVSQVAFAAAPVPPAAISDDGSGPRGAAAPAAATQWAAAFGPVVEPQSQDAPAPAAAAEAEAALESAPPVAEDSTKYWLTGLIRDQEHSVALVHDGKTEQIVTPGSRLSGGEIVLKIEPHSVLIRRDEERFRIGFRESDNGDGAANLQALMAGRTAGAAQAHATGTRDGN